MRIGFDAKRAFLNSSGLGNYSRALMSSLMNYFPEHEYYAFSPGINDALADELTSSGKLKTIFPPQGSGSIRSSLWRTYGQGEKINALQLDIYHGLSNELPRRIPAFTKKVVTIHDLIFLRHAEWYPLIDRNIYYYKFKHACKNANAIVAVSEQTKKDIEHYFNIPEDKIKVIYQSCDHRFVPEHDHQKLDNFRKSSGLPKRYVLSVGTIEERKNLLSLIKAMENVTDCALVAIGRKSLYYKEVMSYIEKHGLHEKVIFPESVSMRDLPLYYQCAEALVYPSRYEGFGIPVIEALSTGVPVITSANSALPEAGGPDSIYIDPEAPGEIADAIHRVLDDSDLKKKMIAGGLKYVQKFHPEKTSGHLMELYNRLIEK